MSAYQVFASDSGLPSEGETRRVEILSLLQKLSEFEVSDVQKALRVFGAEPSNAAFVRSMVQVVEGLVTPASARPESAPASVGGLSSAFLLEKKSRD
jgi:hypothetical protein